GQFKRVVLYALNITLIQLHPNSWAFVQIFELLSEDMQSTLIKCFLLVFLTSSVREGRVVFLEQPIETKVTETLPQELQPDWSQPSGGLFQRSLLPSSLDLPIDCVSYDREGRFGGMGRGVREGTSTPAYSLPLRF
ncbi:hypothetical protein CR513_30891, partial [Mucuna pruriens]